MILTGETNPNTLNVQTPLYGWSAAGGSSYLLSGFGSVQSIYIPPSAGTVYAISAAFKGSVASPITVYFTVYVGGSQVGPKTPATAITTAWQGVYAAAGTYAFAASAQLNIAAFFSSSYSGTLYSTCNVMVQI